MAVMAIGLGTPVQAQTQSARPAAGAARAAPLQGTLLVLGDSLSAEYGLTRGTGWVALMTQRLQARQINLEVVNASISGETTAGGRTRLPKLLERHRPALVVIELGGNDALRGLPLTATETNLRDMAAAARQAGARTVILGMKMPPNYGRAYAQAFSDLYVRVASTEQASLVPFMLEAIADRIDLFQSDRIHPSEQAQPLILDTVWPVLAKAIQSR
jgi:acyl-CoA thioesterase-1